MHVEDILRRKHFDRFLWEVPAYQRAGPEHRILVLHIPVAQALAQWNLLRQFVPETEYWPVIGWDRFQRPIEVEQPVQDVIQSGLRVDPQQWFNEQAKKVILPKEDQTSALSHGAPPFDFRLHLGQFAHTPPSFAPIALLPMRNPWEIPAYLPIQVNEWDPPDAVHVALMKYWYERWGAELVSAVSGSLEMRVLQPPTRLEDALKLAQEHYLYAPDFLNQGRFGSGSLSALAKHLLNSRVWAFWWD